MSQAWVGRRLRQMSVSKVPQGSGSPTWNGPVDEFDELLVPGAQLDAIPAPR